jgi:hypothetical protein
VRSARLRLVARLKGEGLSNRAVAQRVGVSEKAVPKLLRRLGWSPAPEADQNLSASDPVPDNLPANPRHALSLPASARNT